MTTYDDFYVLRHRSLRVAHQFGFQLLGPSSPAALAASVTAVQVAALACAIHDDGAELVHVNADPAKAVGVSFKGKAPSIDPERYWENHMVDPLVVEACCVLLAEFTEVTPHWIGDETWAERLQGTTPDEDGTAARYVRDQWPRITDLASRPLIEDGTLRAPDINLLPALPGSDRSESP
jgi:hypothetical protein